MKPNCGNGFNIRDYASPPTGCDESLADFAEELTSDTAEMPENLAYDIDYERMARDMEMSGDIFTVKTTDDEVHVFWNS